MEAKTFRLLTKEEMIRLYEENMVRDFPKEERKPLARILELMDRGAYEPYALFEAERLIAYALYWRTGDANYAMLDYFAVIPEERNQGTGSALLKEMLDRFCGNGRGVFGEVEAPVTGDEAVDVLRRRRLDFYARAGLRRAGYTSFVFGVPYIILAYGPEIPDEELMEINRRLYREAVSPESYQKYVFIPEAV